jgi:hypothetical protein
MFWYLNCRIKSFQRPVYSHSCYFTLCNFRSTFVLTFICLRATTLSYDVAHRTVRSWRQNAFDCFSRWPWNTLCNCTCGVSLVAGRSGGSAIRWGAWSADCGGGVGKQWTEKESFQQYFYNRYKIVVYTGLRSDCIKNHASRYRHRWR